MTDIEIGDTWNVSGSEVIVIGETPLEVEILWPSSNRTWEDREWLKDLHEKVA